MIVLDPQVGATPAGPLLSQGQLTAIDRALEEGYEEATGLAETMAGAFQSNNQSGKSQLRNFQNVVYSATRFSTIKNFVKNQMGKDRPNGPWRQAGADILGALGRLEQVAEAIAGDGDGYGEALLRLARGWMQQVSAHCLYRWSQG